MMKFITLNKIELSIITAFILGMILSYFLFAYNCRCNWSWKTGYEAQLKCHQAIADAVDELRVSCPEGYDSICNTEAAKRYSEIIEDYDCFKYYDYE